MKKIIFIGFCLLLMILFANAQADSTFYYYQGEKIHLKYNKTVIHLTLKSDCAIADTDFLADNLHFYKDRNLNCFEILLENDESFSSISESVLKKYRSDSRFSICRLYA